MQFLADTSPNAYEKMVDRYLASPRYGEEMARHWLDVARYADTHGLHLDNERHDVGVPRLGGEGVQREPAVRQVHQSGNSPATCCPNPTQRPAHRHRLQPLQRDDRRGRLDRRANGCTATPWTAPAPRCRRGSASPPAARSATTTSSTRSRRRSIYSLYAFFYSSADPALDGNVSTTGPFVKLPTPAAGSGARGRREGGGRGTASGSKRRPRGRRTRTRRTRRPSAAAHRHRRHLRRHVPAGGMTDRNTSRNAADWLTDPPFGAKSGRRVLRQANTFFHEDVIQFRGCGRSSCPANGHVRGVGAARSARSRRGRWRFRFAGGKKVWWGERTEGGTAEYGGGG